MASKDRLDDDDLSARLSEVSFSSPEEKLVKQFQKTYITQTEPFRSVFGQPGLPQEDSKPKELFKPSNAVQSKESEDGWGDLPPSYTAISQDHLFGFSSILHSDYLDTSSKQIDPNSPFARFQGKPVSFTEAVSNIKSNHHSK